MDVRTALRYGAAASLLLASAALLPAQWSLHKTPRDVSVVMLSDLHFDPYRDPAKLPELRSAAVSEWARILSAPDSPTQAADFASLQQACHARGVDSSWAVVNSSLEAAHTQDPAPLFITVSGDLLTHNFDCRLRTLLPSMTPQVLSEFAEKTIAFVALQLHQRFPGTPVYLALGNNDSGCSDYGQSAGSEFVHSAAESAASGFSKPGDSKAVLKAFSDRGDYSVILPASMDHTRLVVLQDTFESPAYHDCGGGKVQDAVTAQIEWLRLQLDAARKLHQHVWVMAHIPPGVDTFASFHKYIGTPEKLCGVTSPKMMLSSDALTDTLTDFADVVRLAVFAHTHMDEMKLLHNRRGDNVPAKLVPSISPINGNAPAFTVAEVQPQSAILHDYTVYVATDRSASGWKKEYQYSTAYKMPDYSASSALQLTMSLARDRNSSEDASRTYQQYFLPGDTGGYAQGIRKIWPAYACAIVEDGGPAFHDCMCPASAETKTSAP